MKKIVLLLLVFAVISCKNTDENTKEDVISNVVNIENNDDNLQDETEYLTIIGDQIWVRSEPKTGEVVMKLDDNTECILLEKGEEQTINGATDYWYKIEYDGKVGWVFGSQTSETQNVKAPNNQETEEQIFISEFLNAVKNGKRSDLGKYFIDNSFYELYNPGAMIHVSKENYEQSTLFEVYDFSASSFDGKIIVGREAKFDMDSYEWNENGYYLNKENSKDILSKYVQYQPEVYDESFIQQITEIQKYITYRLLVTSGDGVIFYFGKVNGDWKIIAIDDSTNDA